MLLKLADNKYSARYVVNAVITNFDNLQKIRNELLLKLADNIDAAENVTSAIYGHFDKLPNNIREGVLRKLADLKLSAARLLRNGS